MIETLYNTSSPQKDKSECYVLVLARRPGNRHETYAFMEEHGLWDASIGRFLHQVTSVNAEEDLTHQGALAMYHHAKLELAQRGFVYSFVLDHEPKQPHSDQSSARERATA